ncbi:MAG: hypothetical protein M3Y13_07265 [Armatimonadota bacterium]|nr:hypothetical protein [Armatimonadota bacterium]
MKRLWQHWWNAPNSLLGLLGGLGGAWHFGRAEGVVEVEGGWLARLLHRRRWAAAITLGDVILYIDASSRLAFHHHEMIHVRQGRTWGPLFLPLYLLESLVQKLRTGDGYRNNRFEREAYESEF